MKNKLVLAFVILIVGGIVSNFLFNHVNAWVGVISYLGTLGWIFLGNISLFTVLNF